MYFTKQIAYSRAGARVRDLDIRTELRNSLKAIFEGDPRALLIDELALCEGEARIDLALINGTLIGFEIKSERDTLSRLDEQVRIYNRTFDKVTIVVSSKHLKAVSTRVPEWWGITEAIDRDGRTFLGIVREPLRNPAPDPFSIAQLLWRDELLEELKAVGVLRGIANKPRRDLWRRLADALDLDALRDVVRTRLKARGDWRSAPQQPSNDAQCQPSATSLDSQFPPYCWRTAE